MRAFRVKARDSVHRISYTVYTVDGRYRIYNLPPSTYEIQVIEGGFESPVETVEVTADQTATVDLSLTATGSIVAQGAGARGATAQRNYGGSVGDDRAAELLDFDTLYPPSPAREVMLRSCFGCHGPAGFHRRGRKNEAGWRAAVDRMFDPNGRVADMAAGVPQVTYDLVSLEEKESIIQYLTANFGPGSTVRDLELDLLVRDEDALSETVYIQYELNRQPRGNSRTGSRRGEHPQRVCQSPEPRRHLGVGQRLECDPSCRHAGRRLRASHHRVLDRQPRQHQRHAAWDLGVPGSRLLGGG